MWLSAIEKAFLGGKEKNELATWLDAPWEEAPENIFFHFVFHDDTKKEKKSKKKEILI